MKKVSVCKIEEIIKKLAHSKQVDSEWVINLFDEVETIISLLEEVIELREENKKLMFDSILSLSRMRTAQDVLKEERKRHK